MTHASNKGHMPPARSAEEYERTIRGLREALEFKNNMLRAASRFVEACHRGDCMPRDDTARFRADLRREAARYPQAPEGKP